jgi:hypothetical protein
LRACLSGKIRIPQRHVEGGVLAAHEGRDTDAMAAPEREWQQQQRPALGVVGDYDEGRDMIAAADLVLPDRKQIETLIGRRKPVAALEHPPDRFCPANVGDDIDVRDAACP